MPAWLGWGVIPEGIRGPIGEALWFLFHLAPGSLLGPQSSGATSALQSTLYQEGGETDHGQLGEVTSGGGGDKNPSRFASPTLTWGTSWGSWPYPVQPKGGGMTQAPSAG